MRFLIIIVIACLVNGQLLAQSRLIADGFLFTEGPAIDGRGTLYFSDVRDQKIYRLDAAEKPVLFLENTGGANGLYFDKSGNLIACAGRARKLIRITPGGMVSTLAETYQDKKLNSPNDLWIDKKGNIYFTDPRYGNADDLEQEGMHVYLLRMNNPDLIRVTNDLVRPNGIVGNDRKRLIYIVDQGAEITYSYRIGAGGELGSKKIFAECGTDGMSIDEKGRVYITHRNTVRVHSPSGKMLNEYPFEAMITNVVVQGEGMYVTTQAGQVFHVGLKY